MAKHSMGTVHRFVVVLPDGSNLNREHDSYKDAREAIGFFLLSHHDQLHHAIATNGHDRFWGNDGSYDNYIAEIAVYKAVGWQEVQFCASATSSPCIDDTPNEEE